MDRRTRKVTGAILSVALLSVGVVPSVAAHGAGLKLSDLAKATIATARFQDPSAAEAAGYGRPPAPAPLHECISSLDGTGAMGYHYIKGDLLDAKLDPSRPEVLVYAPDKWGRLHLAALEYVVFQDAWKAEHGDAMPELFGQKLMATPAPNRYEIPAFYALHVWLWRPNPDGLFESFNPRVSCKQGTKDHSRVRSRSAAPRAGARPTAPYDCDIPQRSAVS